MSRYKAYAEYRDSGIEWPGAIPSHWSTKKLRYLFSFGKGLSITKENLVDEGVPCVNYGEVHSKFGFEVSPKEHALRCVANDYLKISPDALLKNGDFVFADTSEDIAGSGNFTQLISDDVAFAGYHTIIARPIDRKNARYLSYVFESVEFRTQIRTAVKGVKVFSITQAILRGANIWLPPHDEREKIAGFLDHETAKIDALMAKQQALVELLKEKRQAVISHAVTKGLNPNVTMKDSGVEWLGEVPEHWVVGRYKFCTTRIVVGIAEAATQAYADEGVPILRSTNIREEGLDTSGLLYIIPEFAEKNHSKYLYANDVITVRTGYPGISAVIPPELDRAQCFTNLVATPKNEASPYFLAEYLNSHTGKSYFDLLGWGSAQKNISVPILQNIPIAYPSFDEQKEISEYIKKLRFKYIGLIEKAEMQIQLLQERRSALISAAVTGKIDVRDWRAPVIQLNGCEDASCSRSDTGRIEAAAEPA